MTSHLSKCKIPKVLAVVGPTASGKSILGLELAKSFNGEIVAADSMQMYRYLNIGTAKPSLETRSIVKHHLLDIIDPDEFYTAGNFVKDAEEAIQTVLNKRKIPILVGGTGLYLRALLNGLIQVPKISAKVENQVTQLWKSKGITGCFSLLSELDQLGSKKLHENDPTRVLRALKVKLETKQSILEFQVSHNFQDFNYQVLKLGIHHERLDLYHKINQRVIEMMDLGWIDETIKVLKMGFAETSLAFRAIGYSQVLGYLKGDMKQEEMVSDIQQKSRRFAKKQITWNKKENIHWVKYPVLSASLKATILEFIISR